MTRQERPRAYTSTLPILILSLVGLIVLSTRPGSSSNQVNNSPAGESAPVDSLPLPQASATPTRTKCRGTEVFTANQNVFKQPSAVSVNAYGFLSITLQANTAAGALNFIELDARVWDSNCNSSVKQVRHFNVPPGHKIQFRVVDRTHYSVVDVTANKVLPSYQNNETVFDFSQPNMAGGISFETYYNGMQFLSATYLPVTVPPPTRLVPDESDTAPVGTRTPLILVHGVHGNKSPVDNIDSTFRPYRDYFKNLLTYFNNVSFKAKYKIYRFHYVSDRYSVADISVRLGKDIDSLIRADKAFDKPFIIIAHSMGGLVARSYMNRYLHTTGVYSGKAGGERVLNLITLATPHHGTPGANAQSRGDLATNLDWRLVLDVASVFYWGFTTGKPTPTRQYYEPNRKDLLWDNYDNSVNPLNTDINTWLAILNAQEKYGSKTIAYTGYKKLNDPARLEFINQYHVTNTSYGDLLIAAAAAKLNKDDHLSLLVANVAIDYGMRHMFALNDGLVPTSSASFNLATLKKRVTCPNFDHMDMRDGGPMKCSNQLPLFWSLSSDLGLPPLTSVCITPPAGLVGWWAGNGNTNDYTAFANHGTLGGGATFGTGKVGQGFRFDGINDYVQIPDSANLKPAKLTIEAWVKFDSLDSAVTSLPGLQYIVFKKNTRMGGFEGYALVKDRVGGDNFDFVITPVGGSQFSVRSKTSIVVGQFYHVVAMYDGIAAKIYVNGVLENQTPLSLPLEYDTRPVFIGSSGESFFNGYLRGIIDEVSIYNRALSASEIKSIYTAGVAGKCRP